MKIKFVNHKKVFSPENGNLFIFLFLLFMIFVTVLIALLPLPFSDKTFASLFYMQIFAFFMPAILYLCFFRKYSTNIIPLKKLNFKTFIYIVIFSLFIQPMMTFLSYLSSLNFDNNVSEVMGSSGSLWPTLFFLAVTPSICEELIFRGILYKNYEDVPLALAAFVNGLFFGLMHLSLQQFPYAFLLGIMFTFLVRYTGSIFSSIISHFIINGTQTLMFFSSTESAATSEVAPTPAPTPVDFTVVILLVILATLIAVYALKKIKAINYDESTDAPTAPFRKSSVFNITFYLIVIIFGTLSYIFG